MVDNIYELHKDGFLISDQPSLLQLDAIEEFLAQAYWAQGRPKEVIIRSIENSLCFGLYHDMKQVGLARVVTDYATFAWLCDVFIHPSYRGFGLGNWLISSVVNHPMLQGLRRWILATSNAHELYRKYGFSELSSPERMMERFNP